MTSIANNPPPSPPSSTIKVIKVDGTTVSFSEKKLYSSLRKSGAGDALALDIIKQIKSQYIKANQISTKRINQVALRLLKKEQNRSIAARYNLKRAILDLGPDGYAFELYIARLFKRQGYEVKVSQICQGLCVNHEIDIVAIRADDCVLVECKYHNKPKNKSGVQVPLYIRSRFEDVEKRWKQTAEHQNRQFSGWIFTNTHFSEDAEAYGSCAGLKMVSWNYPNENNLPQLIEKYKIYPVTCLTTITKKEKTHLMQENIILCTDIPLNPDALRKLGMPSSKFKKVIKEVSELCD